MCKTVEQQTEEVQNPEAAEVDNPEAKETENAETEEAENAETEDSWFEESVAIPAEDLTAFFNVVVGVTESCPIRAQLAGASIIALYIAQGCTAVGLQEKAQAWRDTVNDLLDRYKQECLQEQFMSNLKTGATIPPFDN